MRGGSLHRTCGLFVLLFVSSTVGCTSCRPPSVENVTTDRRHDRLPYPLLLLRCLFREHDVAGGVLADGLEKEEQAMRLENTRIMCKHLKGLPYQN
jgi:hypothetical protein